MQRQKNWMAGMQITSVNNNLMKRARHLLLKLSSVYQMSAAASYCYQLLIEWLGERISL